MLHLRTGQAALLHPTVEISVDPGLLETLPPFRWELLAEGLVSAAPEDGDMAFEVNPESCRDRPPEDVPRDCLEFALRAGQHPGSGVAEFRVYNTDPDAVPPGCEESEHPILVTVGGDWGLSATAVKGDRVSIRGDWLGQFSLVKGNRLEGAGTITTTVTGSCVRGIKTDPLRISGHLEDDILHITAIGEPDDGEPDFWQDPSLECIIVSVRELPRIFRAMGEFIQDMVTEEPCPLQVPVDQTEGECVGIKFTVRPVGAH